MTFYEFISSLKWWQWFFALWALLIVTSIPVRIIAAWRGRK